MWLLEMFWRVPWGILKLTLYVLRLPVVFLFMFIMGYRHAYLDRKNPSRIKSEWDRNMDDILQ